MPAHLRVSLADRPGALATLTHALAAAGANVLSVTVLQREAGRATDDLLLDWPFARPWDAVVRAVEGCPSARLHGLRHVTHADVVPEGDVVQQVLRAPQRGLEIAVDLLPAALLADWAAVADDQWPREPLLATARSPLPLPTPTPLVRPRALMSDREALLAIPCTGIGLRVLVGRLEGPPFTRGERERCSRLVHVVLDVVRLAFADAAGVSPEPVTGRVVRAETGSPSQSVAG